MALPKEFVEASNHVRNWGRWGEHDQVGTLNLITPDAIKRAAACIRTGKTFSLALPLSEDGPQTGAIRGRTNPARTMTAINSHLTDDFAMSDDTVTMGLQAATHWDALAHVSYGGRIYNGFDCSTIDERGASVCGIDKVRALASRGVLLDVARAKSVERLDGGYAITPDDLDAAEKLAGVTVTAGDVVLIRTGQIQLFHAGDRNAYAAPSPGPGIAATHWFRDKDIAAVATDTLVFEVFPSEHKDAFLAVHLLDLVDMGLTQGQNFDLELLAADCAVDGIYEFFLEASPEPFVRGLGSPVNPIAIK